MYFLPLCTNTEAHRKGKIPSVCVNMREGPFRICRYKIGTQTAELIVGGLQTSNLVVSFLLIFTTILACVTGCLANKTGKNKNKILAVFPLPLEKGLVF